MIDSESEVATGRASAAGRIETSAHQLQFLRFAQYNSWFNGQLYDCVAQLGDSERKRDRGAFFGSIHDTLDHVLLVDRIWLARIERSALPFPSLESAELVHEFRDLGQGVCPDFDRLRIEREATDEVLEAFVRELSPDRLGADLAYQNSKGHEFVSPLWHVVAHLFNHQTHHRGQVTTLLSQAGVDPGMTDFIVTSLMPTPELS